MQGQDALDGTATNYNTLSSLTGYQKCSANDCATCLTDGYPHPNSLPPCTDRFGFCAGSGEESAFNNTPCLQCLELDITDVSFTSTAGRYPSVSLTLDNVSAIYLGGKWTANTGVPRSECSGRQVVALILDYTLSQTRDDCCDDEFGCPSGTGCCNNNNCSNGRFILYVGVDMNLSTGVQSVKNSGAYSPGVGLGDNPLPYWGYTNQTPPGCSIFLQTEGSVVESVTNPNTPYASREDCLSCTAFEFTGSFSRDFRVDDGGGFGTTICEEDTSSNDYFRLDADFHVKKIIP